MHLIQNKLAVLAVAVVALYCLSTSCAVTDAVLDYPMSFFDEETGETTEVPLGDVIADNADGVGGMVSSALGGVNPLVAVLGGGAAAALLGGARRKKKAAVVAQQSADEPEVKA